MQHNGNLNVLCMTISNTIAVTANAFWIMFMPYYFERLFGSSELVGVFFSFVALSTAILFPLGGKIADTIGRDALILGGRLLAVLGPLTILFPVIINLSYQTILIFSLAGYLLVFAGGALRLPAASMLLMESSKPGKKTRNYMIAERVLPSIPPALTVYLGALLFVAGTIEVALLLGALGLALSSIPLIFIEDNIEVPTPQVSIFKESKHSRIDILLAVIILAFVFDGISSQGLSWYIPLYLGEANALVYGLMISLSTLVIALFSLISGLLVDHVGIRKSLVPGWLGLAIVVTIFGMIVNPIYSIILYCVWVALDTVDTAIPPLIVSQEYPQNERATKMGIFSMVVRSSLFIGPFLVAILLTINPQLPFFAKAIMNILAAIIILIFAPREQS